MAILQRFTDIMKANINALLDKAEDPAKMIDQTLRNLKEDLAEVKKETANVMANEKRDKRLLDECQTDITRMKTAAENALKAGQDADAMKLVEKKQELEAKLGTLQMNYNTSKANADKMRQMHDKLVLDINQLESRKDSIKATIANAKAIETVNKMTSGVNSAGSIEAFERYEQQAQKMLDAANAKMELNQSEDDSDADKLAAKYASGPVGSQAAQDEVARMKAQLGLS